MLHCLIKGIGSLHELPLNAPTVAGLGCWTPNSLNVDVVEHCKHIATNSQAPSGALLLVNYLILNFEGFSKSITSE
jgi:hypothetical protein